MSSASIGIWQSAAANFATRSTGLFCSRSVKAFWFVAGMSARAALAASEAPAGRVRCRRSFSNLAHLN